LTTVPLGESRGLKTVPLGDFGGLTTVPLIWICVAGRDFGWDEVRAWCAVHRARVALGGQEEKLARIA
jgi:hypothetical protein